MRLEQLSRTAPGQWVVLAAIAISVLQLTFPQVALAQVANRYPAFQINITNDQFHQFIQNNYQDLLQSALGDPVLDQRKELLREYLSWRGPRFAEYTDVLAEQEHWRRITAIAFAESTLGKYCYYNNCWGIGGYPPTLRKYPTLAEGIIDANSLLERRYSHMTYQQMCGIYVVPCNPRWMKAVTQIEAEIAHIP